MRASDTFACLALLLGGCLGAGDEQPTTDHAGPIGDQEAFTFDAQSYARDVGIPVDQAKFQLTAMREVGDALADLEQKYPDTFAGMRWNANPFYVEVSSTRPIENLEDRLATAGIRDVELRTRTVRWSIAQLNARLAERVALVPAEDLASAWLDVDTNAVVLGIRPSALTAVTARLAHDLDGVRLEPKEPDAPTWGGASASGHCTTGFGLWETYNYPYYDPVHYFTTAAHCENTAYINCPGGCTPAGSASVIHGYEWKFGRYDFQAMYVPNVQAGYDYWDGWQWRIRTGVVSWYSIANGNYFCKYGISSGYTCGFVITKYHHGAAVPGSEALYVETGNSPTYPNQSAGGDSGGPFFIGGSAVGLMQGAGGPNQYGQANAYFMSVTWITATGWGLL